MWKKGKAHKKLLISFILIFLLPIMMALVFNYYMYENIEKRMEVSNNNLLQTIQNTCDREIMYYQNILSQLQINEAIHRLGKAENLDGQRHIQIYKFVNELKTLKASMNLSYCKDVFVYFPKIDRVVSFGGSTSFVMYNDIYLLNEEKEWERIKQYLENYHSQDIFESLVRTNLEENAILLSAGCYREGAQNSAVAGILMKESALKERVDSVSWEEGYDWLIVNSENQIVKYPDDITKDELFIEDDIFTQETLQIGQEEYVVRNLASDICDWTYILLMPEKLIRKSTEQIRIFFGVSIIISVFIGSYVSGKLVKVNYAPLNKLMGIFGYGNTDGFSDIANEYDYLNQHALSLIEGNSRMKNELKKKDNILKKYYLSRFLVKHFDEQEEDSSWKSYCGEFGEGWNLVLLLIEKQEIGNEGKAQKIIATENLRSFIATNVFSEVFGEKFLVETVEFQGKLVMILNAKVPSADYKKELLRMICTAQKFVVDYFHFAVLALVGEFHEGIGGIQESYLEACETEEFLQILDQDYIFYDEVKDRTVRKYNYSLKVEERIVAAIREQNPNLAITLINKVLEVNYIENKVSSGMLKCLLYDIYSTILKVGEDMGRTAKLYSEELTISLPLNIMKEKFSNMVMYICGDEEEEQGLQFYQRVMKYIEENYSDQNLNISQLALKFHMTPSNLSALFKRETGEGLLKVINQVRIKHAIELLNQGYSVGETAHRVGITESSTFIRLFKKYTGITPGQMKK